MPVDDEKAKLTVPVNWFKLVRETLVVPDEPCCIFTVVGLTAMLKSVTMTRTVRVAKRVFVKPVVVLVTVYIPYRARE